MLKTKYDFGGYATKANIKCTDGRTILRDAFKDQDGEQVPLVWQHMHNAPDNVLGHAILENREDGVYAYCIFNNSKSGQDAKTLVIHGDVSWLSIYANGLIEKSSKVIHGVIREVSLVLAGANPGAKIDNLVIQHEDGSEPDELEDEAIIYTGLELEVKEPPKTVKPVKVPHIEHAEEVEHADGDKTVGEVFESLTEEQKTAVYAIIGEIVNSSEEETVEQSDNMEEGEDTVKHNVFEGDNIQPRVRLTPEQFTAIVEGAYKCGSFKESFLAHAGTYGIDNIDYLFPDAKTLTTEPDLIKRDMEWVASVIGAARHTPFSRIKTVHADITVETARARGYVTGALKVDEVFALLKRTTNPTTIYKKQKLDRDDILDITDLDIVAWLKMEMRIMLDEELARSVLISDGRDVVSADKVDEACIRPIYKDADLYAHKYLIPFAHTTADIIDDIVIARSNYKGSGSPSFFTTTTLLSNMLLLKDSLGRRLYANQGELESALRVAKIVEVPVMDGVHRDVTDPAPATYNLLGILVNMRDYSLGADKGGAVSMFDDFDIDYNQFKYLLETRCSGALTLPKSAIIYEQPTA